MPEQEEEHQKTSHRTDKQKSPAIKLCDVKNMEDKGYETSYY